MMMSIKTASWDLVLNLKCWWSKPHGNQLELIYTFIKLVSSLFVSLGFYGCTFHNYGDSLFSLQMASHGKDVMWVPTKIDVAREMLAAASVNKTDIIYDLGSGDGIIPIEAARYYGVRAVGIEYNPELVELSRRNAIRSGVNHLTSFLRGDIFVEDFSKATILTLYLGEELNVRLMPKILKMQPGTRVISNTFRMDAWIPDREIKLTSGERAYLWIVPAQVDGQWALIGPTEAKLGLLRIRQKKQFFNGILELKNQGEIYFEEGFIQGEKIRFKYSSRNKESYIFEGALTGGHLTGSITGNSQHISVQGIRLEKHLHAK